MDVKKIARRNKILVIRTGSHLYGTNTSKSDEDFCGIFLPSEDMVFGYEQFERGVVDLSVVSKRDDGKNDEDAIDFVMYEFRKFIKLSVDNNPNILEMLFVNDENIVDMNGFGEELLYNKFLFPSLKLVDKFLKYASSQKHKMIIRSENYHDLEKASEYFDNIVNEDRKKLLVEIANEKLGFIKVGKNSIKIGDLNFQKHLMLRKVDGAIKERLSKATNRKNLLIKYGYDTKFAANLIRLLVEGIELLETGGLEFPMKERKLISDIKTGKHKITEVLKMAEEYEDQVDSLVKETRLPTYPSENLINTFVKKTLKKHFLFGTFYI